MKQLTKSALLAVTLALFGAASGLADDSHALQTRAATQSAPQSFGSPQSASVAVYTGHGRAADYRVAEPPATNYVLRSNGHGQVTGEYRQGQ